VTHGRVGNRRPEADLSYVVQAAESIVSYLRPDNLVVLESTVPPRTTTDLLVPILERGNLGVHKTPNDAATMSTPVPRSSSGSVSVAHCPERVLPGRIMEELVHNDRSIGGVDQDAAEVARQLYASFVAGKIFVTDATTAEMMKLMENTYREVNIALANEFALVAEQVGINVWEAIALANRHPRVQILQPGPGVGGIASRSIPGSSHRLLPTCRR
jgi:UDP-N-acetyl-D-mannosaminuronic acid dehydrogenase